MYKLNKLTDGFTLSNGHMIPCVGYGTWQTPDGDTATRAVKTALEVGYRHIDAAACYENEGSVGRAIAESGVAREELFVTSKVWNSERGYQKTLRACQQSLDDLGLDYLDLYLIHWPASPSQFDDWVQLNLETWRAMIELYQEGLVRAIGVSNFLPHHLDALMQTEIAPMVNQIEFHPGQMQQETVAYCKERHIQVEAYSPLGTGRVLQNLQLQEVAAKYERSVAQLCLRWCLQHEVIPLPKSITPSRIMENAQLFDFVLSQKDMEYIDSLPYMGGSGNHPDKVKF